MAVKQKASSGGNRKIGRDKAKCEKYRKSLKNKRGDRKKFTASKRQRGCTPLGYLSSGRKRPPSWQELDSRLRREAKAQAAEA